jgi:uncharacterized protein YjiS (DUF1127 family)
MTEAQMKRGIELLSAATRLRKQLDEYVLLKKDAYSKEVVCLGYPERYNKDSYHRVEVSLTDDLRRYAFRLWKREQTIRYNEMVRELNQLGVLSDHRLRDVPSGAAA